MGSGAETIRCIREQRRAWSAAFIVFLFAALSFFPVFLHAQTLGCDTTDACIGNALSLNGNNQYVDVPLTPIFNSVDSLGGLTVEMWMNVTRQPGMVQVVAGKWGPRRDRDDEWLMLIDQSDTLRFRVSNGGSNAGDADNTEAVFDITPFYNTWVHLAGEWDSTTKSVRLYINGVLVDSATNPLYPPSSLRRTIAYMQIASFNGFSNAAANYRTFDGQMDEIRVWNVARPADSLHCSLYKKFTGTESGLIAYYRCNGGLDPTTLCDASTYANDGLLRNGAAVAPSARTIPLFLSSSIPDTLRLRLGCSTDTTVTFTITDTSVCGDQVQLSGAGMNGITITPPTATLQSRVPQQFTFHLSTTAIGALNGFIIAQAVGSCAPPLMIPVFLQRNTPLTVSVGNINFDTLHGCQSELFQDSVIQFCNTSAGAITITNITKQLPEFDTTFIGGWQTPLTLQPGTCNTIHIRFRATTDSTYIDTLKIFSNDSCSGSGAIVLRGTVKQYLKAVDSVDFGDVYQCGPSAYAGKVVDIVNTDTAKLTVTSVQTTSAVYSTVALLPLTINPNGKQDILVSLQATAPGTYDDSLIINANVNGCTVRHVLYVHARVFTISLSLAPALLNFGNQFVGTTANLNAVLKNTGIARSGAYVFLKIGKVFHINPPNTFLLQPGDSALVSVGFSPPDTLMYYDTLLVQDTTCFNIVRIPIQGHGVNGPVVVSPGAIDYGTVFSCDCMFDTITIFNNRATPLLMQSVSVNGAGFALVPPPSPNVTIPAGATEQYIVEFCGTAIAKDGAYQGTVTFNSNDATTPVLTVQLTAVRTSVNFNSPVFTDYGVVEVNTSKDLIIKVQNASLSAVCIDSVQAPPGFQVIATNPVLPDSLGTTRVLQVTLRFLPTAQAQYDGQLKIYCHCPCAVVESTEVKGLGAVLDISFPWTTIVLPQATPCDTVFRDVVLGNPSHQQVTINSITITGPNANSFSWQGVNFNGVPTVVDSLSDDTIRFYFYAGNSPLPFVSATLTLITTTIAGQDTFVVTLSGSKKLQFIPSDDSISFGAIAVRTPAATQNLYLYNGLVAGNIVIDSLYLVPDAGVFHLTYPPLPITLAPGDSLVIAVDFTPKAARFYKAHIAVHIASPCPSLDSSIVVTGSGFTPVVLINMCFDTATVTKIGDTFTLPIVASRIIPQTPVDMTLILNYDVYAVRLESVTADSCAGATIAYTNTGAVISLKTCVNLDSGAVCLLNFRALVPDSVVASIALDSISFAADTMPLPSLLAQGCGTTATINAHCCISYLNTTSAVNALAQNAPNPVSDVATIAYQTTEDTRVQVRIFDMLGREATTLVDEYEKHGNYSIQFDARALRPGMYYYTIDAGLFRAARMMSVVR